MTTTYTSPFPTPDVPAQLQIKLMKHGDKLVMLPAAALEALELAKDPNCSVSRFSLLVQRDTKLATDILSMANSAAFAPVSPIVTLHQAVVRLGFWQCRNLIVASSVASLMQRIPLEQEWIREVLAQHSYTTAVVGVHLNRVMSVGFHGEEFTAGLIHDFGRLLLAVVTGDDFGMVDPLDFDELAEADAMLDRETAGVGTNHCELGAWFAGQNGLPESLVHVIRLHHTPFVPGPHQKLVALTAAADHLANHLQRFGDADSYDPESNYGITALAECGVRRATEVFLDIVDTLIEAVLDDAHGKCFQAF
ncbi:MAG: HDOD domain-containing protein [Planctomycetales bacterium]|nr:HDOD domain-containing protein [Planctomycetales bacterium]MCA9164498.1 HDOD domain-containing protein [Planctomycetales bacterium]MCA9226298.1 HDOD domain-containing protein [Planctomycetales bacterium]